MRILTNELTQVSAWTTKKRKKKKKNQKRPEEMLEKQLHLQQ